MVKHEIIDEMTVGGDELQQKIDSLPSWRREQAMKYKFEAGRRECALSYLLLCDMLRRHLNINDMPQFSIGEHGKPEILSCSAEEKGNATTVRFNISHCKRAVACVISDTQEVGIDVECTGRYSESLAAYCMSEEENERIRHAEDPDALFTELWTQKEALLKLTGEGITDDIKGVLTSARMKDVVMRTYHNINNGYIYSIASRQ